MHGTTANKNITLQLSFSRQVAHMDHHNRSDKDRGREGCGVHEGLRCVQYSTVQYSTVQYSTVLYCTIQHSTLISHLREQVVPFGADTCIWNDIRHLLCTLPSSLPLLCPVPLPLSMAGKIQCRLKEGRKERT